MEVEVEVRKIVVIVEEVEVAKTALIWALHNVLRFGDLVTLLHVFPVRSKSRNRKKLRLLRLKGFQLALSFKDICLHSFPNVRIYDLSFVLWFWFVFYDVIMILELVTDKDRYRCDRRR